MAKGSMKLRSRCMNYRVLLIAQNYINYFNDINKIDVIDEIDVNI